jgi:hypothetical protein
MIECVPKGSKPCQPDAQGNRGVGNTGQNNIGTWLALLGGWVPSAHQCYLVLLVRLGFDQVFFFSRPLQGASTPAATTWGATTQASRMTIALLGLRFPPAFFDKWHEGKMQDRSCSP